MFDSREAVWISGSIGVLIVILLVIRFDAGARIVSSFTEEESVQPVTVREGQTTDEAVVEALAAAASVNGTLHELVLFEVESGTGAEVVKGSTVTIHYVGNTDTGVQFTNSYTTGEPYTVTLGEGKLIEGLEQGLFGMKEGGRRAVVVPARFAYGSRQVGPIAPNSPLVFVVEVLAVQ